MMRCVSSGFVHFVFVLRHAHPHPMAQQKCLQVCYGRPKEAEEQVVLLSQVLACDATVGFEDVTNEQVLLSS